MTGILNSLPLLLGTPDASAASGQGSGSSMLMTLGVFAAVIVVFWLLVIRPQNRKQKEAKKMLESVRKGDVVVTIGGLHAVVDSVKEDVVVLRVEDNVRLKYSKSAISTIKSRDDSGETKE